MAFITLEEAAGLEGVSYDSIKKRIHRNPSKHKTVCEPTGAGGKQRVLVDINSLSLEAQKKFIQENKPAEISVQQKNGVICRFNLAELEAFVGTKRYKQLIAAAEKDAAAAIEYIKYDNHWGNKDEIANKIANKYDISTRTLYRKTEIYRQGGTLAFIKLPKRFVDKVFISRPSIPPEVESFIRAEYLQEKGPLPSHIKQKVDVYCKLALNGITPPSKDSIYRYIQDMNMYEPDLVCFAREGAEAYERKFGHRAHRKDPDMANQVWEGDHHRLDFFVEYNGKPIRPWLTAWFDVCTRTFRGFTMATNANGRTITTALRHGILKKKLPKFEINENREIVLRTMARIGINPIEAENELSEMELPHYGLPDELYIDNGEDYKAAVKKGTKHSDWEYSREILSFCELLKISHRFCTAYHPESKGHCERSFRTLTNRFSRFFPGYCGSDGKERPESLDEAKMAANGELLTLDEAYLLMEYCIHMYHNMEHSSIGMSPFEKVATAPLARTEMPNERELDICLMDVDRAKVSKSGITKFGSKASRRFYDNPALDSYKGQEIIIRWDPNRIGELLCFDPKRGGKYICTATNDHALSFGINQDDIKENAKRQAKQRKAIREKLKEESKNTLENVIMERVASGKRTVAGTVSHPETDIPMITPMGQAAKARKKPAPKPTQPHRMAVNGNVTLSTFDKYMIDKGKGIR